MKLSFAAFSLCWIAALVLPGCATVRPAPKEGSKIMKDGPRGAGPPRKVIKLSSRTYGDGSNASHEIKTFYLHLLEADSRVRQQFDSLSMDLREDYGPHFLASDPQVVEWFPREDNWNAPEEFQSNANYLVIQPIGCGRGRHAGSERVIVSEFHVTDSGKAISRGNLKEERMSTTMTITFLGFRQLRLDPIKPAKSPGSAPANKH